MNIRLDKLLCNEGFGTRTEVKKYITSGRVRIDGAVINRPELKVDSDSEITVDNRKISCTRYEYYMLNKPAGVVSATEDKISTTVVELISERQHKNLFPVGRLDKDTEGLLIITDDGDMAHRILSPKKHVDKKYFALISGKVEQDIVEIFRQGIKVDDELTALPAELEIEGYDIIENNVVSRITLIIREGKFHQVKRMFKAVGFEVKYLKRIEMGGIQLDGSLKPGEYRPLTQNEIELLGGGRENNNA